jgi:hypothetical protein
VNDIAQKIPVPAWASFFSSEQYGIFLAMVEADLRSRCVAVEMGEDCARVEKDGGKVHHLGLQNLAQRCLHHPETGWANLIAEHFVSVLRAKDRDVDPSDFSRVAGLIKLKLYADEFPPSSLLRYTVAPGIEAVLTVDLPDAVVSVSSEVAAGWGKSREELFALGLSNALAEPCDVDSLDAGEGASIRFFSGDSFYVTTRALQLDAWISRQHPHGALLSIPSRHALLLYPIESMEVVHVVGRMIFYTRSLFRQGPGSISPELFWWRGGEVTLLPSREEDGKLVFSPTANFLDCIERLAQPPS